MRPHPAVYLNFRMIELMIIVILMIYLCILLILSPVFLLLNYYNSTETGNLPHIPKCTIILHVIDALFLP